MKQLLSIEFAKLKKLSSAQAILLVYFAIVPLWMFFMGVLVEHNPAVKMIIPHKEVFYVFPNVWKYTTYCASWFNMMLGVIVVIITCNEIYFRTWKQNVIDGLTKQQVILGKFCVILILSTIVTLYTIIVSAIFGSIYSDFSQLFDGIENAALYYLQTIGYFSFAFFFAVLVRRPALSICLFIASFLVESIIGVVLKITVSGVPYQFFPLKAFADLTPIPFLEEMRKAEERGHWQMPLWGQLCLSAVYILLFFGIAYRVLKRRDL